MNNKVYATIGACGIDCGLCPRYHTRTASRCPGCAPEGFLNAGGQWCKMTRCAVRDRGYETCADCAEFPCYRFEGWDQGDSFVSHLSSISNLHRIRSQGVAAFAAEQRVRIRLLQIMLDEFDEGRSKSYCCVAAALLPLDELKAAVDGVRLDVKRQGLAPDDRKPRAKLLRQVLDAAAERLGVSLKLRKVERD